MALVTLPDSDYTVPTAKRSPKIAVNMLDDVGALVSRSVLVATRAVSVPGIVRDARPKSSDTAGTTPALISLGLYPAFLNGIRVQRVADLMHNSGVLANRLFFFNLLPDHPEFYPSLNLPFSD